MDEFDIYVVTRDPATGAAVETPMRSSDPDAAPFINGGRAFPLTPEARQRMGVAQESARRVEAEEGRSVPGIVAGHVMQAVDETLLGALSASDPEIRQQIADQAEARPLTAGATSAATWILPALLSGGESAAARAALLTPSGLAARAGLAAEGLVGRTLARTGIGRGVSRGVGLAAGAGVDGLLSGMAESIANANITGSPLEAEQILSDGAFGALLGAGAGGLFAAPGMLRRGARAAEDVPVPGRALGTVDNMTPVESSDGFIRYAPRELRMADTPLANVGMVSGQNSDRIRVLNAYGEAAYDPDVLQQSSRASANRAQDALNRVERVFGEGLNAERRVGAAIDAITPGSVPEGARLGHRQRVTEALGAAVQELEARGHNQAAGAVNDVLANFRAASMADEGSAVRALDNVLAGFSERRLVESNLDTSAAELLRNAEQQALAALRDYDVGGQRLARFHEAWSRRRERTGAIRDFASIRRDPVDGLLSWRIDEGKLARAYASPAGEAILDSKLPELAQTVADASDRLTAAEELLGIDIAPARADLANAVEALQDTDELARVRRHGIRAQLDEKQNAGFFAGLGLSGASVGAGFLFGGPVGAAIGGTLAGIGFAAATHPVGALRLMGRAREAIGASERRLAEGVGRLEGAVRSGRYARAAGRVLPPTVVHLRSAEQRKAQYSAIKDRVLELAGNPDAFMARLGEGPGTFAQNVHPALGDQMSAAYVRGIQYLASQLPPSDQPSLYDLFEEEEPSLVEMDSFINRWEALEDPLGIVDMAAEGRLEMEHVEAVQAVFPELYAEVQARVTQMVADLRDLPSYQQRMELGTLLGVPVDRTLSSSFVHSMQQTFAQTTQQDQAQTSRTAFRRSVSMSVADDTHTVSQSIQHSLG